MQLLIHSPPPSLDFLSHAPPSLDFLSYAKRVDMPFQQCELCPHPGGLWVGAAVPASW